MKNRAFVLVLMAIIGFASSAHTNHVAAAPVSRAPIARPHTSTTASPPIAPGVTTNVRSQDLADAMGIKQSLVVASSFDGSDVRAFGIGTIALGNYFPSAGSTFAILSTGRAEDASLPNSEGNRSFELAGTNNAQGNDLVQLSLQLRVPQRMNCASFEFAFFSEEFPEFVGSSYNDTFTVELDGRNIVFDSQGNPISVNTVFGVTANTATTYDGQTPLLRAETPVIPGTTITIVFSIQDLGDPFYDSAVFLDKFLWSDNPNCGRTATPTLSPTFSYYVRESWNTAEWFNGREVAQAYRIGYETRLSTSDIIILSFGRQMEDPAAPGTWGVKLILQGYQSNQWVTQVAQSFIDGYNDGHDRPIAIAIGVNNANYPWACKNPTRDNPDGNIAPDWAIAGNVWGHIVSRLTPRSIVTIKGANDFEPWANFFDQDKPRKDRWAACSIGALQWQGGFQDMTHTATGFIPLVNFGNDAHVELPEQWPKEHVHALSFGASGAQFYPQIYCKGHLSRKSYLALYDVGPITFAGVTADDGHEIGPGCTSGPNGRQSFSWSDAWNMFNDTLTQANHAGDLGSSVTIPIYYP